MGGGQGSILHELLKYFVTLNICNLHFQRQMEDGERMREKVVCSLYRCSQSSLKLKV